MRGFAQDVQQKILPLGAPGTFRIDRAAFRDLGCQVQGHKGVNIPNVAIVSDTFNTLQNDIWNYSAWCSYLSLPVRLPIL